MRSLMQINRRNLYFILRFHFHFAFKLIAILLYILCCCFVWCFDTSHECVLLKCDHRCHFWSYLSVFIQIKAFLDPFEALQWKPRQHSCCSMSLFMNEWQFSVIVSSYNRTKRWVSTSNSLCVTFSMEVYRFVFVLISLQLEIQYALPVIYFHSFYKITVMLHCHTQKANNL